MLAHLRKRVLKRLAEATVVKLATSGPAGIQVSPCRCRAQGLRLFLRLPEASEHLVNLEAGRAVALTNDDWRLTGIAEVQVLDHPFSEDEARWHQVIRVVPQVFEFLVEGGAQASETVDIEVEDL